jgi:hypothetical protein
LSVSESGGIGRLAMAALKETQRLGVARSLPVARVVLPSALGGSLPQELSRLLGEDVKIAVRIPHWQDMRSLVVRAFGNDGRTLAFAKLALDQHGRTSVEAESRGLRLAAHLDLAGISAPRILHQGDWRGHELLVTSPLAPAMPPSKQTALPLAQMRELATACSWRQSSLRSSAWWEGVCRRVEMVEDERVRARFEDCLERLDSGGDAEMSIGATHGDWTPWNMTYDEGRVLLWDWEHSATDVPFGFDHLHFTAQRRRVTSGTGIGEETAWLREVESLLDGALCMQEAQRRISIAAYLLEVNLRFILDRQSTSDQGAVRRGWGLPMLDRESRRVPGGGR